MIKIVHICWCCGGLVIFDKCTRIWLRPPCHLYKDPHVKGSCLCLTDSVMIRKDWGKCKGKIKDWLE